MHTIGTPFLAEYATIVAMWSVMTVGMMLPVTLPWARVVARMDDSARTTAPTFWVGYFVIWIPFALLAAGIQMALKSSGLLSSTGVLSASTGGVLLIAAGLYQFSGLKTACLRHCRSPLSFVLTHWDARGPWYIGLRHGLYCLGCCVGLMALAFVLGVMNTWWMAALTALVFAEQWTSWGFRFAWGAGVVLLLFGASTIIWS